MKVSKYEKKFKNESLKNFYGGEKGWAYLDVEIAEAIILLNKKGYKTLASCAGHKPEQYPDYPDKKVIIGYIYFDDDLKKLPRRNFKIVKRTHWGEDFSKTSLYWICDNKEELKQFHKDLLDWVRGL